MLGWTAQRIVVIDEDLGLSGAGIVERSGFDRLTAEVAPGYVGIVLGLELCMSFSGGGEDALRDQTFHTSKHKL
jgi:hypothetical protein